MSGSAATNEGSNPRRAALEILSRVERGGAYASVLLERREAALEDRRDAGLLHEIVLGVLRRRRTLDELIAGASRRTVEEIDPSTRTILRIACYTLCYLDRIPAFAAVDSAVRLAGERGPGRAKGFVNAVLRRIALQGRDHLPKPPERGDVAGLARFTSHPDWWVARLVERLGFERARRLLEANNRPAATVLAPNRARVDVAGLAAALESDGISAEPCRFADALRVKGKSGRLGETAALREGLAWVQDEAAQLVGDLVAAAGCSRVVDFCAAPGGKTLQLAGTLSESGRVVAVDRHAKRLRRLVGNVGRVGAAGILPLVADMATTGSPLREGSFDRVLVDAPCSGTGTLRRHPEIRWRLQPESLKLMAVRQLALLRNAARACRPGGIIVYAVCSLEPEEGPEVVERFLREHPEFERADPRDALPGAARDLVDASGHLTTSPVEDGMDGFFAARLARAPGRRR